MSRMEDYKYTSLEQRVKTPFAGTIPSPENMALEKFIHGKRDEAHHEGKRAELRRMAEADQSLTDYKNGEDYIQLPLPETGVIFPLETAQPAPVYPIEMHRRFKQNGGGENNGRI